MPVDADAALHEAVRSLLAPGRFDRLGVAVSGGSDSLALLHVLADRAQEGGPELACVTVDHGLRPEAAAEAAMVARVCAGLGVSHDTLRWQGWDGKGNLPDRARRARYGLIGDWARARGIAAVALGHTLDDQAETFLMRLARGSGVDGLAAMAAERRSDGIVWLRPLLGQRRGDLRQFLQGRGVAWVDDPTNEDPGYDRVKARAALAALGPLGLTPGTLAATAGWMRLAREVLEGAAAGLAGRAVSFERGDLVIARPAFDEAPQETRLRLLAVALRWVAGGEYRPRAEGLIGVHGGLMAGKRQTIAGCLLLPRKATIRVTREHAAVAGLAAAPGAAWDGRWRLAGPGVPGAEVRALGAAGLAGCPGWRATGLPRASLLASPAVWVGDRLIAAPLAGRADGWSAELLRRPEDFRSLLIAH